MSAEVIAVAISAVGLLAMAGRWIWVLSGKLRGLEDKAAAPVQTMPPMPTPVQPVPALSDMKSKIEDTLKAVNGLAADQATMGRRVEQIQEDVKWVKKLQMPSLERVIEDLAKETGKVADAIDKLANR